MQQCQVESSSSIVSNLVPQVQACFIRSLYFAPKISDGFANAADPPLILKDVILEDLGIILAHFGVIFAHIGVMLVNFWDCDISDVSRLSVDVWAQTWKLFAPWWSHA